jgi:hypothetical protein
MAAWTDFSATTDQQIADENVACKWNRRNWEYAYVVYRDGFCKVR